MSEQLLQVSDLSVAFRIGRKKVRAIQNVSFSLERGRTLGIVGESGCGKSVTATAIMRLLPRDTGEIQSGSIRFDGQELTKLDERGMRAIRGGRISMIFQDPMTALNPVYRIEKQLMEMLSAHTALTPRQAHGRCLEMLERVGIPEPERRLRDYPHQLSGGMRQRIMIAMALSTNPDLLIADEPTTALDVTIQAQILDLIARLREEFGTAVMLITHDMGVIAEVADDVMVMYAGEVVEYTAVEALFAQPLHPYTQGLLRAIPRLDQDVDALYTIEGTVPSLAEMPDGCRFADRCPSCTPRCRAAHPPLVETKPGRQVRCWRYAGEEGSGDA